HIGAPAIPLVKKGDEVKKGQPIADPGGFVSVPVHSPVSGKVVSIGTYPHAFGRDVETITIESDGADEWHENIKEDADWESVDAKTIRERVRNAGLAGMGGAAFPTHVKLSPPEEKPINTVIINGAECEPYLTSDHRLMLEKPAEILAGAQIVSKAVGAKRTFVGIEDNKPDAVSVLKKAVKDGKFDIKVVSLPVKYPQGAEKQLINAITGREVPPPPGLPMDVGCLVQNVGSCVAIYNAVRFNKPLIERYVTVSGHAVNNPVNLIARIGTPFSELVEAAGGYTKDAAKLLNGGPMMGSAQWTDMVPVIKGTSGIVVLNKEEAYISDEQPCICCGRCISVCPVFLLPTNIARLAEFERFEDAENLGALECMECGSCTYVCPSKRNLVHHIRFGKTSIMALKKKEAQQTKSKGA
ncbi:MAG: electron transport complex subunit RsxC, partial [Candidatus Electryonea clarkiae]|nr:electron transport complex subunit RsxC [Candidatus Electryonea clarkiae]